jgi:predicted dehydrogenase
MPSPFIARPSLLSGPAGLAADPLAATGRTLRWGVVATGAIAAAVTADLALLQDAELHAVSSRRPDTAQSFAERFGFARWYADSPAGTPSGSLGYEQLVADPAVEVVYVATPHAQHYAVTRAALSAGKHVLVEKPFTINSGEGAELVELARSRGLFLMEAVWTRFLPGMQRVWDVVAAGEIGPVQWVTAELGFPGPAERTARLWARADGGGALLDLGVYATLWAWGVLGLPDVVHAVGTLTDEGVDAQSALTFGYPGGAQAQLATSLIACSPNAAVVCGTHGWVRSQGFHSVYDPTVVEVFTGPPEDGDLRVERYPHAAGSGRVHELREVTRCVQESLTESPVMPLDDTLALLRLLDDVRGQLGVRYPNDEIG